MLGHKAEAEAVVITRERLHVYANQHGADYSRWQPRSSPGYLCSPVGFTP
ncbi:MAG: hypothetical protein JWM19_2173 [Actinomycetia bacterium]|nr:hypothetical protein [Actinomycetes bacterium]